MGKKIQVYGYFNVPYGSIPYVCSSWIQVLKNHFDIKVCDYSGLNCRFENVIPFLGEHNPHESIALYFGYPSYKPIREAVFKHKKRIGVFVTETKLSGIEIESLYTTVPLYRMICVPSKYCADQFKPVMVNHKIVQVINHGVCEEMKPILQKSETPKEFKFLYVFQNSPSGGTYLRKNLDKLLEAHKLVNQKRPCKLVVKTSGNIEKDVTKLANQYPNTEFIIKCLTRKELAELYNSCDAYVNVSRAEGFGMTPMEAMACGIPVISPVHSGLSEYLNNSNCVVLDHATGVNEYKFATNDGPLFDVNIAEIVNAMNYIMDNHNQLLSKADKISHYIRSTFSWNEVLKKFIEMIQGPEW